MESKSDFHLAPFSVSSYFQSSVFPMTSFNPQETELPKVLTRSQTFPSETSEKKSYEDVDEVILKKRMKQTDRDQPESISIAVKSHKLEPKMSKKCEAKEDRFLRGILPNSSTPNKKSFIKKFSAPLKIKGSVTPRNENEKKKSQQTQALDKKIVRAVFDHEKFQVVYVIEYGTTSQGKKEKTVTRNQILKYNPQLLLQFYESHLQFTKTQDFEPEKLKMLKPSEIKPIKK